jgi:hypothetical protein
MEIWGPIYHCELQEENSRAYVPNLYIEKNVHGNKTYNLLTSQRNTQRMT